MRGNGKVSTNSFMTGRNAHGNHLVFQNEAKNIPRQNFVMMIISCKFENSTCNTFGSRGLMGKFLHTAAALVVYPCIIHSILRIVQLSCFSDLLLITWPGGGMHSMSALFFQ